MRNIQLEKVKRNKYKGCVYIYRHRYQKFNGVIRTQ